jgi:Tol biopolymer transport system component
MTVIPRQIGHYQIHREIGRGGMGVVHLARDTKLQRDVAIKMLPENLAGDVDRLSRFEREARLLASLNHANVAAVYGLEEVDGVRYLILEFIDGEDLSDRLADGALPVDEALYLGKQIASAVEAAHAKGVIHRDLKPANVKVTVDGDVKVLDFGLAKAFDDHPTTASGLADSPTIVATNSPTVPGVVLGTAGYMSPEQARGKQIDKRSDIWSFGCILYEMLTGTCPFPGDSVTESLGATIHKEPDWTVLPEATPPSVQLLLHRCLQKDRSRRLQDIGDARVELDDTLSGSSQAWTGGVQASAPASRRPGWPWLVVTTVLLVIAVGLSVVFSRPAVTPAPVVRASVPPPANTAFIPNGDQAGPVVISPDGRTLAFTAMAETGRRELWVRPLASGEARVLSGTHDAEFPFWSADSRSLGFFVQGTLKRVDLAGGTPITICEVGFGRGGTWNADDVILFAPGFQTPIYRVAATGGTPVPVTTIDSSMHTSHRWPSFLPNGEDFLYSAIHSKSTRAQDNAVYFGSLTGGTGHEVIRSGINAECAGDRLLFVRDGTLLAAPFDADAGRVVGDPVQVADAVACSLNTWKGAFSCSPNGVIAYHPGGLVQGEGTRITIYDRGGREQKVIFQVTAGSSMRLSPDGGRIAFARGRATGSVDVWSYDVARDLPMRLSFLPSLENAPVWSPDGSALFFSSHYRTGPDAADGIYRMPAGGGAPRLVLSSKSGTQSSPLAVAPDGRYLLYSNIDYPDPVGENTDLWVLPLEPPGEPFVLLETPSNENLGRFSPDGRWLAYSSDESGRDEVYVMPFVDPSAVGDEARPHGKWQISNGGGGEPIWSHDGTELYFLRPDEMLMAVAVKGDGGSFESGTIEPLFQSQMGIGNAYDVTPDGRFVVSSADEQSTRPVALILNWTSLLNP